MGTIKESLFADDGAGRLLGAALADEIEPPRGGGTEIKMDRNQSRKNAVTSVKRKDYRRYAEAMSPPSPLFKNMLRAFLVGGAICTVGQALLTLYRDGFGMAERESSTLCSVTLVFVAALLTGIGVFDNIARWAGAGTLVPITGFANSVVSSAIDSRSEGLVLGVGAKIFTVAGPVLLYGTLSGVVYGVVYFICGLL